MLPGDNVKGKRITNIQSITVPYGGEHLTTVAVSLLADANVYILRYLSRDNRIFLNYIIKVRD